MKAYRREGNYRLYILGSDHLAGGRRYCQVWLGQYNNAEDLQHLRGTLITDFNVLTNQIEEWFLREIAKHQKQLEKVGA